MASYFIRNYEYSKSKQYVAFKFSIYRYYVSFSCFALNNVCVESEGIGSDDSTIKIMLNLSSSQKI